MWKECSPILSWFLLIREEDKVVANAPFDTNNGG